MKKKKKRKIRSLILGSMLFLSSLLLVLAANDIAAFYKLRMDIQANTLRLEESMNTKDELETEKRNLTNPDYLEFMARGKYHVSREGEQVFVFPALSNEGS